MYWSYLIYYLVHRVCSRTFLKTWLHAHRSRQCVCILLLFLQWAGSAFELLVWAWIIPARWTNLTKVSSRCIWSTRRLSKRLKKLWWNVYEHTSFQPAATITRCVDTVSDISFYRCVHDWRVVVWTHPSPVPRLHRGRPSVPEVLRPTVFPRGGVSIHSSLLNWGGDLRLHERFYGVHTSHFATKRPFALPTSCFL